MFQLLIGNTYDKPSDVLVAVGHGSVGLSELGPANDRRGADASPADLG